jgi:TetR/AcrR family transcriptional repressor of nem operon
MGAQQTPSLSPVTPKGRRTREALIEAGSVISERDGLAGLSISSVVEQAGVAKGTFYLYFPDRQAFIDALHQRFYARVTEALADAVSGLPPGPELLLAAIGAYLDVCLANHGVKALVFETRVQENLTTTMQQRESLFARLAEPSVRAIGMEPAPTAARLIIALTSEAALIEMEAGRKHPGARDIIRLLLNSASETAATAEEK